jgi:hypothetical protein
LKQGDIYDLDIIKAERERIDQYLKNEGFFYFSPDYLVFYADTAVGEKKVNLRLGVKDELLKKPWSGTGCVKSLWILPIHSM